MLLPFHREIIEALKPRTDSTLTDEDGLLLIMARGLGLSTIVGSFVHVVSEMADAALVFILNATVKEELWLADQCEQGRASGQAKHFTVLRNNVQAVERMAIYKRGGVISTSARMLIVDLLNERVPLWIISGFLICHVEKLTESSMEAFVLYLYRQGNKDGFIRGFSEIPESFSQSRLGLSSLGRFLSLLRARKALLYPRFHTTVQSSLMMAESTLHVLETRVALSKSMSSVQSACLFLLQSLLTELSRLLPGFDLSSGDWGLESALFKSFESRITLSLAESRVSPAIHAIIDSIRTIRAVLFSLISADAVTLSKMVEGIFWGAQRAGALEPPLWMMTEAADVLFTQATMRLPKEIKGSTRQAVDATSLGFDENPKWQTLATIVSRHVEQRHASGPILILVEQDATVSQLTEMLTSGSKSFLLRKYRNYLIWKKCLKNDPTRPASFGAGAGSVQGLKKKRFLARVEKERKAASLASAKTNDLDTSSSSSSSVSMVPLPEQVGPGEEQPELESELASEREQNHDRNVYQEFEKLQTDIADVHFLSESMFTPLTAPYFIIQTYSAFGPSTNGFEVLDRLRPSSIVLYDPDLAFIRSIETYSSTRADDTKALEVHFLIYEDSIEETRYLFLVRKEKEAFEKLIQEKATLSLVQDWSDKKFDANEPKPKVLVDMREFRSALPFDLYKAGFSVAPVTLEVADYILSPRICVERKTIADLVGSFANGRLLAQVSAMSLHYPLPILLVEFDPEKSFFLQSGGNRSKDITLNDLSSKLVILLLNFPKLRVLWSCRGAATCELFTDLQKNEEAPSVQDAMKIGALRDEGDLDVDYHLVPKTLLSSLPGLTSYHHPSIFKNFYNLQEMMSANLSQLTDTVGTSAAEKLHHLFHYSALSLE